MKKFKYKVVVSKYYSRAWTWLIQNKYQYLTDFIVDNEISSTTFWFKNKEVAVAFALVNL